MDLDSLKYAELRRLAKEVGLKANVKADKLLKALKQHYQEQQHDNAVVENESNGNVDAQNDVTLAQEEQASTTPVFVTKRRGKGTRNKRKISELECDPKLSRSPVKVVDEVAESSKGLTGSAKRRRLSTADNTGTNALTVEEPNQATEQQKLANDEVAVVCDGDFKKLHEAHFNKMESLDSYVQRKTKQMESFGASVKELKLLSDKALKPSEGKTKGATPCRASLFSPSTVDQRPATDKRRHTQVSTSKPTNKAVVPFRPSVLSTRRINVRFSKATEDNEHKRTLVKTPARMSLGVARSTPGKTTETTKKTEIAKTMVSSATKTPGTAFVFNGDPSVSDTPGTNKKSNFDLKASLSRPLGYKPHKGKLKPFGVTKENTVGNTSLLTQSQLKNYKQHQVQTRDERRNKHTEDRKQKKDNLLGARRGLVLA
ncbi:nucleolar and spindle-associated protein 1 [Aplochiton taeniatus]